MISSNLFKKNFEQLEKTWNCLFLFIDVCELVECPYRMIRADSRTPIQNEFHRCLFYCLCFSKIKIACKIVTILEIFQRNDIFIGKSFIYIGITPRSWFIYNFWYPIFHRCHSTCSRSTSCFFCQMVSNFILFIHVNFIEYCAIFTRISSKQLECWPKKIISV